MLTIDEFSDLVGETFDVTAHDRVVSLRLDQAEATAWSELRQSDSFRLSWSGPAEAALPQGTYVFRHDEWEDAIMIVPIARQADQIRYEAIFN